eukprot:scaffold6123_cov113-Isochrysis_galbana.AAC.5
MWAAAGWGSPALRGESGVFETPCGNNSRRPQRDPTARPSRHRPARAAAAASGAHAPAAPRCGGRV